MCSFSFCLSPSHTPPSPPTHTCHSPPVPPVLGLLVYRPASRHRGVNWSASTGGRNGRRLVSRRSRAMSSGVKEPHSPIRRHSASPFPIFLVFHPSVASLSAAVSHESKESLSSLLAVAAAAFPRHSDPAAFVPSSISSASVPHLRLFPGPLFKSWNKR